MRCVRSAVIALALGVPSSLSALAGVDERAWAPDHIVLVVLENRSFSQVTSDPNMPYLHSLARGGALMTQSYFGQIPYGIRPSGYNSPLPARPSQPNYLFLFSGHHQGITPSWFQAPHSPYVGTANNDAHGGKLPAPLSSTRVGVGNGLVPFDWRPFTTPNLGSAIVASGRSFASFAESLPYPRYDAAADPNPNQDFYRRKHNPVINWVDFGGRVPASASPRFVLQPEANLGFTNTLDPSTAQRYRGFAVNSRGGSLSFDQLPTVGLVVPNEQHDLHNGDVAACDAWLRANIKPYADWARTHNSLLIITFDEDGATDSTHGDSDKTGLDRIVTIFYGPADRVVPGRYDERIDHLNILATILDRYDLLNQFKRDFIQAHTGIETQLEYANLRPIKDVFGEGAKLDALP